MKCDERLEALLNRAGQTISDLPKTYPKAKIHTAVDAACDWNGINTIVAFVQYILHLTDIIDRMETALENVCGERDYLHHTVCDLCFGFREEKADFCETCMVGDGVPEDWRADDDHSHSE